MSMKIVLATASVKPEHRFCIHTQNDLVECLVCAYIKSISFGFLELLPIYCPLRLPIPLTLLQCLLCGHKIIFSVEIHSLTIKFQIEKLYFVSKLSIWMFELKMEIRFERRLEIEIIAGGLKLFGYKGIRNLNYFAYFHSFINQLIKQSCGVVATHITSLI